MDLRGKTALITGAARRIGRATALRLAREGARIVLHYYQSRKDALALKDEIARAGSQAELVPADFGPGRPPLERRLRDFVRRVYSLVPRVDILINNASVYYATPFGKVREKEWDEFLTVNLKVPFFLSQAIGTRMARQGAGKIINLVDWTEIRPPVDYLPYVISKAGLSAATLGLARALAPAVQVTAIAPGPILPPSGMKPAKQKAVVQRTLAKRFGSPRDIAEAVVFLIRGSDFITGTVLPVDGGARLAP